LTQRRTVSLRTLSVGLLVLPLRLYQWFVSPLFPPACRFEPSCSHYAVEALTLHGPRRGIGLAMRRLSRCHPFTRLGGSSGFDPVPPLR
jgi:putative membrane protein insertion efficiency factor